jgi:hypothetical protein
VEPISPAVAAPPASLEYVPRAPLYRRRKFYRWIVAAVVVGSLIACKPWWSVLHRNIRLYYFQHECISHSIAPGMIVYSSNSPPITTSSPELIRFVNEIRFQTVFNPREIAVYLGVRRASNGRSRFIAVTASCLYQHGVGANIIFLALNRSTGFGQATSVDQLTNFGGVYASDLPYYPFPKSIPEVVIYSAIEDPADTSRFSIAWDMMWRHYVMDCQLLPDGHISCRTWYFERNFSNQYPSLKTLNPLFTLTHHTTLDPD